MKLPSRAAYIAYSGQCRRQVGMVSADGDTRLPGLALHRRCCGCQHGQIEPERLAHRPRLERTAARRMRRIGIPNLGDVSHPCAGQVLDQRVEKSAASLAPDGRSATVNPYPGLDVRTDQPGPHGALMIRSVPGENAALITRDVAYVIARKSSKPKWS